MKSKIDTLLIANRGEIACRIMRTARRLGIKTVAVYSDIDAQALHVQLADEAVLIGSAAAQDSYLRADRIIDAAIKTGAQAIHPGYGFLSENADFAGLCEANGIIFVGPPASAIEAMGSKSAAKSIMENADVPLVPGYHQADQSLEVLKHAAHKIGYPVLLKAVAGGGGKGMRQVWQEDEFEQQLELAKSEAKASFDNDVMLVEKYLTKPRHVEVQVFFDTQGQGVYLFERDCSVQRRHQKVIEEAPAPNFSDELRQKMGAAALRAGQAIDYVGAGTVEFLLDEDGSFYFMEMNTRLQVEHPVTEMITGQDLVAWQLNVAEGKPLPLSQDELHLQGHAFEARIYAEDPFNDFLPTAGKIVDIALPEGEQLRIDTGVVAGDEVSPFYDPMIAKLVVWSENRASALGLLQNALSHYHISGITNNIEFLSRLAEHPDFMDAKLSTRFIEQHADSLLLEPAGEKNSLYAIGALLVALKRMQNTQQQTDPWQMNTAWRMNNNAAHHVFLDVDGEEVQFMITTDRTDNTLYSVSTEEQSLKYRASLSGKTLRVDHNGILSDYTILKSTRGFLMCGKGQRTSVAEFERRWNQLNASGGAGYKAPMNGTIVDILVSEGDEVMEDQTLLVMEAMKMQHTIKAACAGTISAIYFKRGDLVDGGSQLLELIEAESD